MNPNLASSDEWEVCPNGTLQALAKRSQQQRTLKRATWAILLMCVMLFALGGWLQIPFSWNTGSLACDQVVKILPAYATNKLSVTQRAQVERHLKKCGLCAEKFRMIQTTQSVAEHSDGWIRLHPVADRRLRSVILNRSGLKSQCSFMPFDLSTRPVAKYRTGSQSVSVH